MLEIAQCRCARVVEPLLHSREVTHACRMRQIVGQWPDAREDRNDVGVRVSECEFDRLRLWRGWLTPHDRGILFEQGRDEFPATLQRSAFDDPRLKLHEVLTEKPRLTL